MATATKATKERKTWYYENGVKTEFKYTPSGKLSKLGEWMKNNPDRHWEYANMRAIMR